MKAEELRTKTADQLNADLAGLKKEAFNLRFQQANGQLENTARVRAVRRDIARIMTFLGRQGQAAGGVEAAPAPKAVKKTAKPKTAKSAAEPKAKKAKTSTPKAKAAAKKAAKAKA